MVRFDEVELEAVPLGIEVVDDAPPPAPARGHAPWWRRTLAILIDLSLFAALALALSPLLPQPLTWMSGGAMAGFVVVLSYYYFVGSWLLWGKTIGGAIFDVRRPLMTLRDASMRYAVGLVVLVVLTMVAALVVFTQNA
jgi:hypothetical protein